MTVSDFFLSRLKGKRRAINNHCLLGFTILFFPVRCRAQKRLHMHALTTSQLGGDKYDLQIMQRHLPQLWPLAKLIKGINIVLKNRQF